MCLLTIINTRKRFARGSYNEYIENGIFGS